MQIYRDTKIDEIFLGMGGQCLSSTGYLMRKKKKDLKLIVVMDKQRCEYTKKQ